MCVVKQYHHNYFFVKVNIFIKLHFFLLEHDITNVYIIIQKYKIKNRWRWIKTYFIYEENLNE